MILLAEGKQIKGKYKLERELTSGGMGALWIAFDQKLRRRVVIKFVHTIMAGSAQACARFEREASSTAQIRSPYVIQTYDYGIYRGLQFLVLELLDGEDLSARLTREGRIGFAVAQRMFVQVLKGLHAVHSAWVIHRDLKPANIFVTRSGEEEIVKLLDFGIARARDAESWLDVTRSGQMLGTPRYMSPEQVKGARDVDARSDLWSVAVILYRALTGVHAFPATHIADILTSICEHDVRDPSQIVPDLPPGIDALFQRALARDPERRFQSATQMIDALSALSVTPFEGRRKAITKRMKSFADPSLSVLAEQSVSAQSVGSACVIGGVPPVFSRESRPTRPERGAEVRPAKAVDATPTLVRAERDSGADVTLTMPAHRSAASCPEATPPVDAQFVIRSLLGHDSGEDTPAPSEPGREAMLPPAVEVSAPRPSERASAPRPSERASAPRPSERVSASPRLSRRGSAPDVKVPERETAPFPLVKRLDPTAGSAPSLSSKLGAAAVLATLLVAGVACWLHLETRGPHTQDAPASAPSSLSARDSRATR